MVNVFAGGWLVGWLVGWMDGRGAIGWWELCGKVSCTLRKREAFFPLDWIFDLGPR